MDYFIIKKGQNFYILEEDIKILFINHVMSYSLTIIYGINLNEKGRANIDSLIKKQFHNIYFHSE